MKTDLNQLSLIVLTFIVGCGSPAKPSSTENEVCEIVAQLLVVERSTIRGTTTLAELKADALDFVEIILEMEERFSVSIPEEACEKLLPSENWRKGMERVTVAKLAKLVDEAKLSQTPTSGDPLPRE